MINKRTGSWPVLTAALLMSAACGKKENAAPEPVLSAPDKAEKVPAQAEVKASSGPIELSFLVHTTQIKAGESIWQQIRIKNIGDKEIIVADRIFNEPRELRFQSRARAGIYLEAVGPDGKPLKVEYRTPVYRDSGISHGVSGLLEVDGPEEQAMLDGWKRQGLSPLEINMKLIDFNTKKQRAASMPRQHPVIKLLPGQSAETKYAFFHSVQDILHKRPASRPIGDFAQLDFFVLEEPGIYKVRAVYDGLPGEISREVGMPSFPWDVLVRTPWVSITVLP